MYFPTEQGEQPPEVSNPSKEQALLRQARKEARKRKEVARKAPVGMSLAEAMHLAIERALERSRKYR